MYTATAALSTAAINTNCNTDRPKLAPNTPSKEAPTMNSAFRMLLAPMMRDRVCGRARCCTVAFKGTTKNPPNMPMAARSNKVRHAPSSCRNAATPATGAVGCGDANTQSSANTVSPMEPKGTRPISTLRPESRSHNSDPTATPTENPTMVSVTSDSEPCSTVLQ